MKTTAFPLHRKFFIYENMSRLRLSVGYDNVNLV